MSKNLGTLRYLKSTVRNLPKSALVGSKRRSLGKLSIPVGKPNDVLTKVCLGWVKEEITG